MTLTFCLILLAFSHIAKGQANCPIVLGHRGAAGIFPEHTTLAYEKGADFGADYIECDVQITKDLHLVCSHEAWIKEVCDIEKHPEFLNRKATYNMDDDDPNFDWNDKGDIQDNYFTFDFELSELQTLKRRQVTEGRNPNFDYQYSFVTFDEFVEIAKSKGVGIAPEIKSPTAVNKILASRGKKDVTVENLVLEALAKHDYIGPDSNCLLQCFELSTLEKLKTRTSVKKIFLLKRIQKTDDETLERIKNADIFSVCLDKELIVPTDKVTGNCLSPNQNLLDKLHNLGLQVYAYTFANELSHQCWDYYGDARNELNKFLELRLDGYFSDYPNTAHSFVSETCSKNGSRLSQAAILLILIASLPFIIE